LRKSSKKKLSEKALKKALKNSEKALKRSFPKELKGEAL
jgi:hypothetical protein